jgi:hypothetical protein
MHAVRLPLGDQMERFGLLVIQDFLMKRGYRGSAKLLAEEAKEVRRGRWRVWRPSPFVCVGCRALQHSSWTLPHAPHVRVTWYCCDNFWCLRCSTVPTQPTASGLNCWQPLTTTLMPHQMVRCREGWLLRTRDRTLLLALTSSALHVVLCF